MQVDIRLLGGFKVIVDGEPIPDDAWRRRHAAGLVKLLALQPGRRLLREQVMDTLWPDLPVAEAAPRLHKAAHFARNTLGTRDGVVLSGDTVSLFPRATVTVDVELFDRAADAAVAGNDARLATLAIDRYRGDLLPDDLYEPWAEEPRERGRLRYLALLRQVGRWRALVDADPADEEAHLRLIQEHLRRGDRRAALRQSDQLERVLREELGVVPSQAAVALREEVLALPADLDWTTRATTRSTPVPRPTTPTIGRDRDVALTLALLERSRLVTLVGPGGVGKTRLAAEVALHLGATAGLESCFVDLTKVDDAVLVPDLVSREMGIHTGSDSSSEQLLEEALRGRPLLLVLDNFEHVIDAADIAVRILQWSPDIRVLTTSRARLHVPGEHIIDVAPLAVGAEDGRTDAADPGHAVALFAQVAASVDPHFELEPNLAEVAAICRSLDGLPLAIELAAGHTRTLPPVLLRSRLSARLGSSAGAPRGAPARQQTVTAMIDWSLQRLGAIEQELFARLGVFAGSVPLEAIEAVCADPGSDAVGVLGLLVDQSLVRRVTGPRGDSRFVLLELLRERARELLSDDGARRVRQQHARYFADLIDDIDERRWSDAADRWIDLIAVVLPDVRAAHGWALENSEPELGARIAAGLGTYWHREGHFEEGRAWVSAALPHEPELDGHLAGRLRLAAGFVEWPRDQLAARQHWERSCERFRDLGDDRYLAYSLAMIAGTHMDDGDQGLAMKLCDESIALARLVDERPLLAQALNVKGELARLHGDDDAALAAYEEGRALAVAAHDETHLSFFLANLSYLASHRGEHEAARDLGREALRMSWSLGRRMMAAWTTSELAGPELALGRPERGARLVGAADQALSVLGAARQPGDRPEYDRVVTALRSVLGDDTFCRLSAEGARLTLDDAVALALSDPDQDA